ncbi:class D sortase [Oceanirhabdus seepicola]|uniref:Class D sortase n=1 Tax=Oceanirhabdus seepicola TaxID=2828781 RepID=A0A9J6P3X3_9CLOT|nr:class D sortase [Oceanirhabdus seepicola]MCM1990517.1 class D sortase [Oceanirhabdus seepicola]
MRRKEISEGKSHKRKSWGILFGIPLLLFISGIALITIGTFNYMKYAFFLSRIFIEHDYKPSTESRILMEDNNKNSNQSGNTPEDDKKIFPEYGEEFGNIIIESASIDYPVINGDSEKQLLIAVGHYFGSRYPGENGNVVLAGHRNSLFKNLGKVEEGEKVLFNANYGKYVYQYEYRVTDIKIVKGYDESIIAATDKERLTLYTCYPFNYIGNAPKRYVVICELVKGTPVEEILLKEGGAILEKTS